MGNYLNFKRQIASIFCLIIGLFVVLSPVKYCYGNYTPIDENQISVIYHVDTQNPVASDSNPGTAELPFKTISEGTYNAIVQKVSDVGVKLVIHPGLYREPGDIVWINSGATHNAPMIVEASENGSVIIDGSDIYTGLILKAGTTNIYQHTWGYNWGFFTNPWSGGTGSLPDICRRREIVFVNDQLHKQVLDYAELSEGSFYVDEASNKIYICTNSDLTDTANVVEIGARKELFYLDGFKNLIVRGIVCQKAANIIYTASLKINRCENVLVEDCTARWNNWTGFSFWNTIDCQIRNVTGSHNGYKNSTGFNVNIVFEGLDISYNNWRGAWGQYYAWDTAGIKAWSEHGITYRDCTFQGNLSAGLWFDTDGGLTTNVVIENCKFIDNYLEGIGFEKVTGPIDVNECQFTFNDWDGICIHTSQDGTIRNCLFKSNQGLSRYGTTGAQLRIGGPGIAMGLRAQNWTFQDNIFVSSTDTTPLIEIDNIDWGTDTTLIDTLSSYSNVGYHPDSGKAFKIGNLTMNLAGWQSATGEDADMTFYEWMFIGDEQGIMKSDLNKDGFVDFKDYSTLILEILNQ